MQISDFNPPQEHPFGMLSGYRNASEKESVLAWVLKKNIEAGRFEPVDSEYDHPTMVADGLLSEHGERRYALTVKAQGLLFSVYGREQVSA